MKLLNRTTLLILFVQGVAAQTYQSPTAIHQAADGQSLFIASRTGKQIKQLHKETLQVNTWLKLPAEPSGFVMDGDRMLITGGGHNGRVWMARNGEIFQTLETGHTPTSPVLSPDAKTLYICNRFDNNVSFIDLHSGKTLAQIPVRREPIAADITPDGRYLFVANHIPDGRADVDYVASKISVIDTQTRTVKTIPLVNGAEGLRDLKLSPDGKKVFATHLMARFLVPTTQLERGWVSTDALSVIDVESQTLQYTVLLDDVDQGFPNPWAIGFSNDGKMLVVSSAGNHEISLINLTALSEKVAAEAAANSGQAHLNAHNNLSFLSGIRKRMKLKGNGPRSLVVDGSTVYVAHYFSDDVEIVHISKDWKTTSTPVALDAKQPVTQVRQGEIYFNDAGLCFQNWLSCATCHPDARTDALNWDLLNDGIGNPKNVKSMLHAHENPRAMWLGVRADAYVGVRAGLRHIQFAVRPEKDAQAIDAYLKSLTAVPSPYLEQGKLSAAAQRGKKIFSSAGCINCHSGPYHSDHGMYDMGTAKGLDEGLPIDVPHLTEAWRTAPYLHDGRAATLQDLFNEFRHGDKYGNVSALTPEEKNDLIEYVLSL
ncbi:c-type cytochrome [Pontiella agarivorans]|uniref:C-type cytochrome n=1 Tax=Pontiella agarivorans TaxID=3038953 RepID=A0ABU5MT92_9BACT|nr:c-type cytochrome [Pontiella agarivorans]MDZ8117428.1 c-type cytochrome [Pontiella agarivorans]